MGAVFDIAVDDEFGVGADFVAKLNDAGDEFIVSGDFAHFFFGAKVHGEGGGVLPQ